jgi:hypothetical protein
MSLLGFCEWLANTLWSIALHESKWGYSILESVHVLSLCLFLGMAVMLDLRFLGVTMRRTAVSGHGAAVALDYSRLRADGHQRALRRAAVTFARRRFFAAKTAKDIRYSSCRAA